MSPVEKVSRAFWNKNRRENSPWLDRLTLSLLKQHPDRDGPAMKRRSCGWSDDFLSEGLTGATH